MNDLMSFTSHKCYTGDYELLPADRYQNTRPQEKTGSTTNYNSSFKCMPPRGPTVGFKTGDIYLQIPPIKPQLDKQHDWRFKIDALHSSSLFSFEKCS